jgi:plasmid stabilization system protein ParE
MAKRVIWTDTARKARREILEYWIFRNKSKMYSKKLSILFKEKVDLLKSQHYLGKPTNFKDVRATLVSHFSIFYKVSPDQIIIVGIWDNRRNPGDLIKNVQL